MIEDNGRDEDLSMCHSKPVGPKTGQYIVLII